MWHSAVGFDLQFVTLRACQRETHQQRFIPHLIYLFPTILYRRSTDCDSSMRSPKLHGFSLVLLTTLLSIFCTSYGTAAQVYKWVDENGRVHYGDRTTTPNSGKKVEFKVKTTEKSVEKIDEKNLSARTLPQQQLPSKLDQLDSAMRPPQLMSPPIPMSPTIPVGTPPMPAIPPKKTSKPVDPTKVPAACKGLVDQIAKVERGKSWEGLAKSYNAACPGITYECNNYRSNPEKSFCQWIERTDSTILSTNNYQ